MSVVAYENFTDPEVRYRAQYQRRSRDDSAGLRVVWILNASNQNNASEKRRISIILFYDFDFSSQRFRLITEEDAMRVRVELERRNGGGGIIGLSYVVRSDPNNRVTALEPGIYVHNNGELRDPRFTDSAQPEHCTMCHRSRATYLSQRDWERASRNEFGELEGYRDFIAWLRQRSPQLEAQVRPILARPKQNFLPAGMVEAIRQRMVEQAQH